MEIAAVDPIFLSIDTEAYEIPVGTMAVIPHILTVDEADFEGQSVAIDVPERTLVCAGQSLERNLYPELSRLFADTGGFYNFVLPDLRKKFLLGIDSETNEIQWGDGVIYFESIPKPEQKIRDVRQEL